MTHSFFSHVKICLVPLFQKFNLHCVQQCVEVFVTPVVPVMNKLTPKTFRPDSIRIYNFFIAIDSPWIEELLYVKNSF